MVVIEGKSILKIGESAGDKETINKLKRIYWKGIPERHEPQTVMNTDPPIGWHRPHKREIGFFDVLSEAYHALFHNGSTNKAYVVSGGSNLAVPYFVVETKDENGATWIDTFTGVIIDSIEQPINDGEDKLARVYFSAYYAVTTPPT